MTYPSYKNKRAVKCTVFHVNSSSSPNPHPNVFRSGMMRKSRLRSFAITLIILRSADWFFILPGGESNNKRKIFNSE